MRFLLSLLLLIASTDGLAGFLLAPQMRVGSFSARPAENEPTPNYYAIGPGVSVGYSAGQKVDFAFWYHYHPGRTHTFRVGEEFANFTAYGGELAFRFSESIYLGLRGGTGRYHLFRESRVEEDELKGSWAGPSGGVAIGAIQKLDRQNFIQTTLDFSHMVATANGEEGKRRFDGISLTFSYVFNAYSSSMVDNSIFKSFLDSMSFF